MNTKMITLARYSVLTITHLALAIAHGVTIAANLPKLIYAIMIFATHPTLHDAGWVALVIAGLLRDGLEAGFGSGSVFDGLRKLLRIIRA